MNEDASPTTQVKSQYELHGCTQYELHGCRQAECGCRVAVRGCRVAECGCQVFGVLHVQPLQPEATAHFNESTVQCPSSNTGAAAAAGGCSLMCVGLMCVGLMATAAARAGVARRKFSGTTSAVGRAGGPLICCPRLAFAPQVVPNVSVPRTPRLCPVACGGWVGCSSGSPFPQVFVDSHLPGAYLTVHQRFRNNQGFRSSALMNRVLM